MRLIQTSLRTFLAALAVTLLAISSAAAQGPTEVEGTADFRNPPRLSDGQYTDTIVTGETVWYAVVYTNGTPYRFEVSLADVDVDADDELELQASFVGPTLGSVGDPARVVAGPGASYLSGHTNVWYITVMLETTGVLGVEHRLMLDIDGVATSGFEDCTRSSECTLDDDLAALDAETAVVEADLNEVTAVDSADLVQIEIDSLRGQLETAETLAPTVQARLVGAQSRLAQLCQSPDPCDTFPDPGTRTPLWAWAVGLLVFGVGAARLAKKWRGPAEPPQPKRISTAAPR